MQLHPTKQEALHAGVEFARGMIGHGIRCLFSADRIDEVSPHVPDANLGVLEEESDEPVELMVVLGGDGTILRAAEWTMQYDIPLLGVNLGHVGFLAEMESHEMRTVVAQVANRRYEVERRLTLTTRVLDNNQAVIWESFAVNEVSLEKSAREKMLDVLLTVDHERLSRWACDGVLVSTPTGSTAYAFSAGGPVMWPHVEAFLLVPLSAHALFARPLVLGPDSQVMLQLAIERDTSAVVWCDGRRSVDVAPGNQVVVERGPQELLIARLTEQPFTTRLVRKFALPVEGWRTAGRSRPHIGHEQMLTDGTNFT